MAFQKSEELTVGLFDRGAIRYAQSEEHFWDLRSGRRSPVYVNVRGVASFSNNLPVSIDQQKRTRDLTVEAYCELLDESRGYNHIIGIPHALTAISGLVAQQRGDSLLSMRSETKDYGIHKTIEGDYTNGDVVIALDDVVTDAGSKLEKAEQIKAEGLTVIETTVLVDREEGGKENLESKDLRLLAALGLGGVTTALFANLKIGQKQMHWMFEYYDRLVEDGIIPALPKSFTE